ncbi:TolC family protein [Aliivibrio fischeri]|uniref:TolC family protein n=1 Tax=Aliivibrio fischeri TaxID=668 RepID=UPI0012D8A583|nr:TolC family protein [Aliivibrio fischeri]MUK38700.1 TolC family protein [Aliivibrio fischeri]MUL04858.1 TolC family protein [Aliivibrio fischeri]
MAKIPNNYLFLMLSLVSAITPTISQGSELSALINEALENNYQIINSKYEVLSSEFDRDISSAFFYPTINASANTTWNDTKVRSQAPSDSEYNSYGYRLSVSQTILDMSKIRSYQESGIDLQINKLKHDKLVNDIIIQVVDNYFSYLKYHSQKKATDAQYRSSEARFKQISRNNELGNLPKTDVYEARAQKESTSKKQADIEKRIKLALLQLQSTTQTAIRPSYDVRLNNTYTEIDYYEKSTLEKNLIESNYEITIAKSNLDKSKRALTQSRSDFYPTLSASANYEYTDSNFDSSKTDDTTYALTLDIPIINGGSDYYDYQKSKTRINQFASQYDQAINDNQVNFEELIYSINTNVESLSILRTVIFSNYLVYKGNQKAYKLGTKTLTDLLNSESDLYDNIREYHSNQYDYIINMTKLYALFGAIDLVTLEEISNRMEPISDTFDIALLENFTSKGAK